MWSFAVGRIPLKIGAALRLNFLRAFIRYITLYFSGAKLAPCVAAQCRHFRWVSSSILQLRSVDRPYVRIFMSSTNPTADIRSVSLFTVSRRSAIKKRNRIGEIGDPWGIPVVTRNGSDSPSNVLIVVSRSCRKLLI